MKLDGGHTLDPVDAGVAGHVAREVERERGGALGKLRGHYPEADRRERLRANALLGIIAMAVLLQLPPCAT